MIEKLEWNIGGWTTGNITAKAFYEKERGSTTYNNQTSIWQGYIGLIYPSDYGYAAGKECLKTSVYSYGNSCKNSDWLFNNVFQWTLTPYSSDSDNVFRVDGKGNVTDSPASDAYGVRPSLYLSSKVGIKEITNQDETKPYGSETNPYILTIE